MRAEGCNRGRSRELSLVCGRVAVLRCRVGCALVGVCPGKVCALGNYVGIADLTNGAVPGGGAGHGTAVGAGDRRFAVVGRGTAPLWSSLLVCSAVLHEAVEVKQLTSVVQPDPLPTHTDRLIPRLGRVGGFARRARPLTEVGLSVERVPGVSSLG